MAKQEAAPVEHDVAVHARDYDRFTRLLKWSTVICFITAMLVLVIIT